MRESDEVKKREKREVFVERKKKKSYEESKETREIKRMNKKKKRFGNHWEKGKRREQT